MRKLIFTILMIFIGNIMYSNSLEMNKVTLENEEYLVNKKDIKSNFILTPKKDIIFIDSKSKLKDCAVQIEGNFDGVEVDIEVTIYDVSWGKCTLFQLGIKALY
ncbi:hypothetical protein KO500_15270 [Cellulophaga baltica]|uniref:hypothetical protein n=1 Tax=Cellulophaga TaxID=104264 RepID=UPI001C06A74B|nr:MULTISPECIES: hypothetical protein [Cellulophaga]MBU2997809.1 hypothetical protein [Cellulophaga baltica]MDO6769205.1 hypothetical protein [Cellulophaga sp. 1_MG-2023]